MKYLTASVAMITYNSSKYLRPQLESILFNLRNGDELVICDDGSKDDTVDIIKSYNDPRIKLYINPVNLGVNGNMNKALSLCNNDIIYLSNADDVWLDGKISSSISKFTKNNIVVVSHDLSITDMGLNVTEKSFNRLRNSKPGLLHNLIKNGFCGPNMCFRKEMLKYILPFPKNMPFWFDEWIGLICEKHGKAIFYNEVYVLWRRHNGCVSFSSLIQQQNTKKMNFLHKLINLTKKLFFFLKNRTIRLCYISKR